MSIVSLPWSEEGYATGSNAGNYAAKVADAAADFACGLARSYPGAVVGNAASSAIQGLWDGLCSNRGGPPPPPGRPQEGGKCSVDYIWNFSTSLNPRSCGNQGECPFLTTGPITNFKVTGIINRDTLPDGTPIAEYSASFVQAGGAVITGSAVGFYPGDQPTLVLARADGLPDSCGDDPGGYPPDTNNPPDGTFSGDVTINNNDGLDVTIPIVYTPVNVGVDVGINLNVGGVNVRFDLGGVTLNFNPQTQPGQPGYPGNDVYNNNDKIDINIGNDGGSSGFSQADRNVINNTNNSVNNINNSVNNLNNNVTNLNDKVTDLDEKVDDLGDKIDAIETCCDDADPDDSEEFDKTEKTEEDEKKEENIPQLSFVKITLSEKPPQSKIQWGEGSPDVVFAGWFEWIVAGYALPRQPIHFEKSIFSAPSFADGYAYTLVNGAQGRATIYKRKVTS